MNQDTKLQLEFNQIMKWLEEEAVSEPGRQLVKKHDPSSSWGRVNALLQETEEAQRLIHAGASVPLRSMEGVTTFIALLGKSAIYSAAELSMLLDWLHGTAQLIRFMQAKRDAAPTISSYADSMYELAELRQELDRCIRYGAITDQASSSLAHIRRQLLSCEEQTRRRVEQAMNKYKVYLQESIVSQRGGHYVIAVKKAYRKRVAGTVWDESASGQTVFIEPEEAGVLQQEWQSWKEEEAREVSIILARLSEEADKYATEMQVNVQTFAALDFIMARGKLAQRYGGKPVKLVAENRVKLVQAIHPLLDDATAVPIDVEIGGCCRQLIITGPNTGGKTVALKTIGLLAMMVQAGLLVPAGEGSRFGLFDSIYADVGDGQSLSQSLSTFSASVTRIATLLQNAGPGTLVLLDELAAGTDPGEGIALSIAILEQLLHCGALTVATTHFNEIKSYAAREEGCLNARMAFDANTLQPLYRLEIGEAGQSHAFAIARKYGLPQPVLQRAGELLKNSTPPAIEPDQIQTSRTATQREPMRSKRTRKSSKQESVQAASPERALQVGDAVWIHPLKRVGIVYKPANERGEVIVQVQKQKLRFNHKRLTLHIEREQLYPGSDYEMDIVFDSKQNRKARKLMHRKHVPGLMIERPEDC